LPSSKKKKKQKDEPYTQGLLALPFWWRHQAQSIRSAAVAAAAVAAAAAIVALTHGQQRASHGIHNVYRRQTVQQWCVVVVVWFLFQACSCLFVVLL
jgi:hypothetical protein